MCRKIINMVFAVENRHLQRCSALFKG
nr:unnamed protein product [Callosobruchus chinensis]